MIICKEIITDEHILLINTLLYSYIIALKIINDYLNANNKEFCG